MKRTVSAASSGLRMACMVVVALGMAAAHAFEAQEPETEPLLAHEPPEVVVAAVDPETIERVLPEVTVQGLREVLPRIDMTRWRQPPTVLELIKERDPFLVAPRQAKPPERKRRGLVKGYKLLAYQLDSGALITIRRKNGVPTMIYRRQF